MKSRVGNLIAKHPSAYGWLVTLLMFLITYLMIPLLPFQVVVFLFAMMASCLIILTTYHILCKFDYFE